jgi:hypothetical protein
LNWKARWAWPYRHPSPRNLYLCLRKSLLLPSRPTSAVAFCAADSRCTLFVNGKPVDRGRPAWSKGEPARGLAGKFLRLTGMESTSEDGERVLFFLKRGRGCGFVGR